jgi:hypothetical protein
MHHVSGIIMLAELLNMIGWEGTAVFASAIYLWKT